MLFILYKGLQMKGGATAKVRSMTTLMSATTTTAGTILEVAKNPAGIQARTKQAFAKTNSGSNQSRAADSHPFYSTLEDNWSILD